MKVPQGHWKTLTLVAALRHDGVLAPCVFDGPINGRSFLAYVRKFLIPAPRPGDIVVLDNLGSHKGSEVRQAIQAAGARLLFLPPYTLRLFPSMLHIAGTLTGSALTSTDQADLRQAQDAAA